MLFRFRFILFAAAADADASAMSPCRCLTRCRFRYAAAVDFRHALMIDFLTSIRSCRCRFHFDYFDIC